jgi:oligopeptide transport system ATP-binding protein
MIDITSGRIIFDGEDISTLERAAMRPVRRKMQMVYQDPFGALDPRMRAKDIIGEPLVAHGISENREAYRERVSELLEMVGLDVVMGERYPHEFSGGQRQRIGIARALALRPTLLVCDEPVSALDVSIQAQIINLLEALQDELGLTYLFIAHDLSVVQHISDRVMVMYLGKVVEIANRSDLYRAPKHPYTQALLSAVPMPSPDAEAAREVVLLEGEVPSPLNPPTGCPFHPRCSMARPDCRETMPVLTEQNTGHKVACHLY